jgi:hypothetical protein
MNRPAAINTRPIHKMASMAFSFYCGNGGFLLSRPQVAAGV